MFWTTADCKLWTKMTVFQIGSFNQHEENPQ